MNKQGKLVKDNGKTKVVDGIEWTKTVLPDGNERQGYTSNPVAGCQHKCRWQMPDGSIAICYAEEVANGIASANYPNGFESHYWFPERLQEPFSLKEPARIFIDSMSDLMGHWVPDEQIKAVLNVARKAERHTFQLLTKNAPRLLKFEFPLNVWPGNSMPPDFMMGERLTCQQQERMLRRGLQVLAELYPKRLITWMSFEPLSWDVSAIVADYPYALRWAVIGAASNGPKYYQPDPEHVRRLLAVLDGFGVPVFFKGNLRTNPAAEPWREDFPETANARLKIDAANSTVIQS